MKKQIAKTLVALREREREQHFTRKERRYAYYLSLSPLFGAKEEVELQ